MRKWSDLFSVKNYQFSLQESTSPWTCLASRGTARNSRWTTSDIGNDIRKKFSNYRYSAVSSTNLTSFEKIYFLALLSFEYASNTAYRISGKCLSQNYNTAFQVRALQVRLLQLPYRLFGAFFLLFFSFFLFFLIWCALNPSKLGNHSNIFLCRFRVIVRCNLVWAARERNERH